MPWKQETVTLIPKKTNTDNLLELPQSVMHSSLIIAAWIIPTQRTEKTSQTFPGPLRWNKRKRGWSLSYRRVAWYLISPGRPLCRCCPNIDKFWKGIQQNEPPTLHYYPLLEWSLWPPCWDGLGLFYERKMRSKVQGHMLEPRSVPGWSPWGSILANFLFCMTAQGLLKLPENSENDFQSNGSEHSVGWLELSEDPPNSSASLDKENIRFFRRQEISALQSSLDETTWYNQRKPLEILRTREMSPSLGASILTARIAQRSSNPKGQWHIRLLGKWSETSIRPILKPWLGQMLRGQLNYKWGSTKQRHSCSVFLHDKTRPRSTSTLSKAGSRAQQSSKFWDLFLELDPTQALTLRKWRWRCKAGTGAWAI